MKLYTKISSERGKEVAKGGNEFIHIVITNEQREELASVYIKDDKINFMYSSQSNYGVTLNSERIKEKLSNKEAKKRLEYLRKEIRAERLSYGDLAELQSLANYIDKNDVELLEAVGVPEFEDETKKLWDNMEEQFPKGFKN